jgi:co-chaperonin GroES (HSP10)
MEKETKDEIPTLELGDMMRPILNRVLVEVLRGSDEWTKGIKKTDTSVTPKPYVKVLNVGENVTSVKPGEYALTREGSMQWAMTLWETQVTILNEADLLTTLSPEVVRELDNQEQKAKSKVDIQIVN